jgi:hypothetical protein
MKILWALGAFFKKTQANDDNTARPHSSLGDRTPAPYAAMLAATGARLHPDQLRARLLLTARRKAYQAPRL